MTLHDQKQDSAISCSAALTSVRLLPCYWSRLKNAHRILPTYVQLQLKALSLNLAYWKKKNFPSTILLRRKDLKIWQWPPPLKRNNDKSKIETFGNFLSWTGLGSIQPHMPQVADTAQMRDRCFSTPWEYQCLQPTLAAIPSLMKGAQERDTSIWERIHRMVSASHWMLASSWCGLCLLYGFLVQFSQYLPSMSLHRCALFSHESKRQLIFQWYYPLFFTLEPLSSAQRFGECEPNHFLALSWKLMLKPHWNTFIHPSGPTKARPHMRPSALSRPLKSMGCFHSLAAAPNSLHIASLRCHTDTDFKPVQKYLWFHFSTLFFLVFVSFLW